MLRNHFALWNILCLITRHSSLSLLADKIYNNIPLNWSHRLVDDWSNTMFVQLLNAMVSRVYWLKYYFPKISIAIIGKNVSRFGTLWKWTASIPGWMLVVKYTVYIQHFWTATSATLAVRELSRLYIFTPVIYTWPNKLSEWTLWTFGQSIETADWFCISLAFVGLPCIGTATFMTFIIT